MIHNPVPSIYFKSNGKAFRLKAHALLFAIAISLIIGTLTLSFMLLAQYYRQMSTEDDSWLQMEWNIISAKAWLSSADESQLPYHQSKEVDLFGDKNQLVHISLKPWGMFDIAHIQAFNSRDTICDRYLVGAIPDSSVASSLYIADNGRPILFAGNTLITGKSFLPESGVKRANIDGQYFTEKELTKGSIGKSTKDLPAINTKRLDAIKGLLKPNHNEASYIFRNAFPDTMFTHSFAQKTIVYHFRNEITIRRKTLKGNIIIISDTLISVNSDTELDGVILLAKNIKIAGSFKGRIQAFATDTLEVGTTANLKYPSVLGMLQSEKKSDAKSFLRIDKYTTVSGMVFQQATTSEVGQSRLLLESETVIHGLVYGANMVQTSGKIFGNLTCQKVVLNTGYSIYENHLLNTTIDRTKLSKYYILPRLYEKSKHYGIAVALE